MTTGLRKVWEWPACYGRRGNDPPRPILIFVAAKEMARLQNTTTPTDASILDFRVKLANRCKLLPVYALLRASILDFKAKLGNRCKDFPENNLLRASILDFRAKLGNRCSAIVAAQKNSPPAAQSWGAGGDRMARRRHNPK